MQNEDNNTSVLSQLLGVPAKWTQDDYLIGDEPFALLYKLRADKFKHARAVEAMSQYALALGLRNFKSLYKDYCSSKNEELRRNESSDSATDFSSQPLELNCGEWLCDDRGVRRGTGTFEEVACPHPILPIQRIVNIDTGVEKMRIAFYKGNKWRHIIVDKNTLASPREIVKLANHGVMVNARTAPFLSDFFLDIETLNYNRIPEIRSVTRLGWIDGEGFSPYVDSLIFDGDANYGAMFSAVRKCGKFDSWIAAAREFRKESLAARIILAASFASVLVKPLGTLPFFVHLWGIDSSTGKTVALMVAASVWASPEIGKYVKNFNGTDVGYERTADFLNSLPMCIDELQLAKNNRGQVIFDVYKLSQGAGRSRGNKTGGIDRTPVWQNAIITTGESPLTSISAGAGAINRVIEVECTSAEKVVKDGRTTLQDFKKHYGHAGREFVERLSTGGIEQAERIYNEAYKQLNSSSTTDKQAIAAALIITADKLATDWIFKDGKALSVEEISGYLATRESVSAGVRGYAYMCDWVASNANKMRASVETGEIYGVIDGEYAYIINSVFKTACEEGGFSYKALLSYLKSNGLIRVTSDNKTSVARRIQGTPAKCIGLLLERDSAENDDEYIPPIPDFWKEMHENQQM